MITVSQPYMPNRIKLDRYLDDIYRRKWLTNNGPLLQDLTAKLQSYLGVENLLLVSNGTLALQVAFKVLNISAENGSDNPQAITTPFTFAATSTSLKWEGVQPVYADIDPATWCLDPTKIEFKINANTRAIVPVHVFGNACEVDKISTMADRHGLKVVYDASHAFGVNFNDKSVLSWGDASTLSFHATKLFHTIEGGAIIFRKKKDLEKAKLIINFGLGDGHDNTYDGIGTNAKMSEFQAAMGLCVLEEITNIKSQRQQIWAHYESQLRDTMQLQKWNLLSQNNHSYAPILTKSEKQLTIIENKLLDHNISSRRYFAPSLDMIQNFGPHSGKFHPDHCPNSRDISSRILCLPIYPQLKEDKFKRIAEIVQSVARMSRSN